MTWYPPGPALLFCPGDRPDRFGKALDRADAAILDLEDAVASVDKDRARTEVAKAALDPDRTVVRVSQTSSPGHAEDLAAVRAGGYRCVMLSKSESGDQIRQVAEAIDGVVLALVETPLGVVRANDIAEAEGCVGLMWGSEDLIAAMGGTASRFAYLHAGPGQVPGAYRDVARHARSLVALAAAAFGRWAIDAVRLDIRDEGGLLAEARDAAALGFAGTACIHPTQAAIIRRAYEPTEEQVDWARRVLAAAADGERVVRVDGHMIDGPLFRQAEAILRRSPA
ncbi:HpcH/HpaI aldolase/citrate lyase family protein [Granulicoccus sp. GXG6511]|uniref:HpcH/HpaI aldolase/citrate lyase family protein n=1 Tax=Granulicoccus sp. GXG6511 TaxID=3381351 RepID=UPI003D7D8803